MDEVEGELKELTGQLEECIQYVTELGTQVEAVQAAAEHSKDDLESLKAELDTKTEEIQAFRQKEVCTLLFRSNFADVNLLLGISRWSSSNP